MTNTLAYYGHS